MKTVKASAYPVYLPLTIVSQHNTPLPGTSFTMDIWTAMCVYSSVVTLHCYRQVQILALNRPHLVRLSAPKPDLHIPVTCSCLSQPRSNV